VDACNPCTDGFGCFFVSSIVKERKRKKIILTKKSLDPFDQFVSMVEREIDIM